MNTNNNQRHWKQIKCPFFHCDNFNSVCCEGYMEKTSNRFIFPTKSQKMQWQQKYCMSIKGCQSCPIHKLANKKYEEAE